MFSQQNQVGPNSGLDREYARGSQLHAGVGTFMAGVMGWMSAGLVVTAAVVTGLSTAMQANQELAYTLFGSPLRWVVLLAPLGFVWFMGSRLASMSREGAIAAFLVFASLMGVTMSYIPLVFSGASILGAALTASAAFGAMALFGWTTKRDLSGMGRFLFMGLIGLIFAGILSWFVPGMSFGISVIGVLLFSALTAYDTQRLRQIYLTQGGAGNLAIFGALELYLDVINLFRFLLSLFSSRD
jgi:FtsH-binding integral membrane protein